MILSIFKKREIAAKFFKKNTDYNYGIQTGLY
jgi:hypothetical protein